MKLHYVLIVIISTRVNAIYEDCVSILSFFKGLNMHNTDSDEFSQITLNCCDFTSNTGNIKLVCNSNNITIIEASNLNVDGAILPQFIPPSLKQLILSNNPYLTGSLPNNLPDSITILNTYGSKLSGNLPKLPKNLTFLDIEFNNFNETLPILPVNLSSIKMNYNQFTGNLLNIPTRLTWLQMNYNMFSGSINFLPDSITNFHAIGNQIDQPITRLPSNLVNVYLSENKIPGPLPNTWPAKLRDFSIYSNRINGTLPSSFGNTNVEFLALSLNQLSGSIDFTLKCDLCILNDNQFNGVVTFQQPGDIEIMNNQFTNVIIRNATSLFNCALDNNPLELAFANSAFAWMCTYTTARNFNLCRTK
eukprot:NODE_519_length_6551_cov_0.408246.p3 type:complete len:362 gc:universal NODE_519_length_6551_cov_0.408246:6072-4987(-)